MKTLLKKHKPPRWKQMLRNIIRNKSVSVVFQPIVAPGARAIYGFEALVRGPSDSPCHSPLVLFSSAAEMDMTVKLELMVLEEIFRCHGVRKLPGKLFVNIAADTALHFHKHSDALFGLMEQTGFERKQLVLEITETQPFLDEEQLEAAVGHLRKLGLALAIDDLGEGFASLKRWSVMKPDFVKIDRHFIDGLHKDPVKRQFIRSVLEIARVSGSRVIAEGLEDPLDLPALVEMDMDLLQGYLIARPEQEPRTFLSQEMVRSLTPDKTSPKEKSSSPSPAKTAGDLAREHPSVHLGETLGQVAKMFQSHPGLSSLPVVDSSSRPVGLIRSVDFLSFASKPFFHEVYGKKDCSTLMDKDFPSFVDTTGLTEISNQLTALEDRKLMDGFMVLKEGRFAGMGRITDLLRAVSDTQVLHARYANPLTLLPGNVPIDEFLQNILHQSTFTVVYWDLNHFKPFNDIYGYARGDELIKLTGKIISESVVEGTDFLGHIGGDDFISIHLSPDWEPRVRRALEDFGREAQDHFLAEHRESGGYVSQNRQGKEVRHELVSLCAGALQVEPGSYHYPSEVAEAVSAAKKMAKTLPGNSLFIERRRSTPLPT